MSSYNNIINDVARNLPAFEISDDLADNPVVLFSFLAGYISENFLEDVEIRKGAINLINELSIIADSDVRGCLDELFIGLYDDSPAKLAALKSQLSEQSRKAVDSTINAWERQYKEGDKKSDL